MVYSHIGCTNDNSRVFVGLKSKVNYFYYNIGLLIPRDPLLFRVRSRDNIILSPGGSHSTFEGSGVI